MHVSQWKLSASVQFHPWWRASQCYFAECLNLLILCYAKSHKSCPTLWDPMDPESPPVSSVHGIPQVRILEWVATPSARGSFPHRDRTSVCYICICRWVLYHWCHFGSHHCRVRFMFYICQGRKIVKWLHSGQKSQFPFSLDSTFRKIGTWSSAKNAWVYIRILGLLKQSTTNWVA